MYVILGNMYSCYILGKIDDLIKEITSGVKEGMKVGKKWVDEWVQFRLKKGFR